MPMRASLSARDPEVYSMKPTTGPRPSDQWIPWYFVLFFAVFIILDSIFVYIAITSQTGVVTDKAYEKGLAYDSLLEESRLQKELGVQHEVSYDAPLLKLSLKDRDGHPIEAAKVTAKMIRPVQAGYDFELILTPVDSGVYAAELHVPLSGLWTAKMEAQWDGQSYRTTYRFVTK